MKTGFALYVFLVCAAELVARETTVVFSQVKHSTLFDLAKSEKKGVMLYFHFDGCGACLKMENSVLKDEKVVDYLNRNFINYEINTMKGDGMEINKLYKIKLHPTFLFFDNKGNEIHKMVGVFDLETFYLQVSDAMLSDKSLTNYKRLYEAGNRDSDFLFEYAYMLRDAQELDSAVVNEYLNAIGPNNYKIEKNLQFIYEFCIHNFKPFFPFHNPVFTYMLNNKDLFYEHFDSNQVKTRIVWTLNSAVYDAIEKDNERDFQQAIAAMKDFDNGEQYVFKEMDGRVTGMITAKNLVLTSMLLYYDKSGDRSNYAKTLDEYVMKIWNDSDELNNFAWGIFEQTENGDKEKIPAALKCSKRAIELNSNYANNDTYAWLLYRSGENDKALSQARIAIEIAKKEQQDFGETQKLIDLISKIK